MKLLNIVHEEFSCQRDGLKIRGTMFRPKGAGPFPFVIVSHEFMMNRITTVGYAHMFAKLGFAAFCYDFNGGGTISQSEGKTTEMSVATEVKDLYAVIDFAKAQSYTDNDHMILMGCSQGGFVSGIVASELGADVVERLIMVYPALTIPDDARKGQMIMARFDPNNIPDQNLFCGPIVLGKIYPETVMHWDAIEMVTKYRGPVYITHGTKDHIVDYNFVKKAFDTLVEKDKAAVAAGEIPEMPQLAFETIKNGEHVYPFPPHRMDTNNTIREFVMGREEILRVDVRLNEKMKFAFKDGKLDWNIPFTGKGFGRFYNGTVKPGASDQRYYGIGVSDVTADYTFEGKDYTGEDAEVHVINRGVPGGWKPTVTTTSKALDFINHNEAFGRLRQRGLKGPLVRIFMDYDALK